MMPTYTPHEGMLELKRRIRSMALIPERAVSEGHRYIMAGVPVYTGTYKRAVQFELSADGKVARVFVDEGSLKAAATSMVTADLFGDDPSKHLDYIYQNVHGKPPEGPYVERIEEHGRPTDHDPSGKDLWLMAWGESFGAFTLLFEQAARGLLNG